MTICDLLLNLSPDHFGSNDFPLNPYSLSLLWVRTWYHTSANMSLARCIETKSFIFRIQLVFYNTRANTGSYRWVLQACADEYDHVDVLIWVRFKSTRSMRCICLTQIYYFVFVQARSMPLRTVALIDKLAGLQSVMALTKADKFNCQTQYENKWSLQGMDWFWWQEHNMYS